MKINNNIAALNAYRNLNANQFATSKNLEKLSSGLRINRAADDAAGLAISEKMRSQIRGLKQSERNSMDGISLMQTAEGALQEVHAMLQRMRELAVQGANDTNTEYDREQIQKEIDQLKLEVDSVSEKTEFNTRKLLNGSSAVLTSITDSSDNGANIVGLPKVMDARLQSDIYHLRVEGTKEVVTINQPNAGITSKNDIILNKNLFEGDKFYPQAFGEYTINIRNFNVNTDPNDASIKQYNALIQVNGPDGLPIEELSVPVNESAISYVSIGGLLIDPGKINGAGTVKASIEQQATFSVYRGDGVINDGEVKLVTAGTTLTTKNGIIRHGGMEFNFDNAMKNRVNVQGTDVMVTGGSGDAYNGIKVQFTTTTGTANASFAGDTMTVALYSDPPASSSYNADDINALIAGATGTGPDGVDFSSIRVAFDYVLGSTNLSGYELELTNVSTFAITNNALAFQIGPNTNQNVMIDVPRLDVVTLGIENIDVTTQSGANQAIYTLDKAINVLSDVRAKLGATQNRMEHTINNLQVTHENLTAAESRIRDADMALEMTEFTRNNIVNQAATAMLAQANQLPQGVLQLLQ